VNRIALVHALAKVELIAIYFHSFEIFMIKIIEMPFCKPEFIIIRSNYFQSARNDECFLDDFEALVRKRRFRALVLQNGLRLHSSARTSISRTMRSRNVISHLKFCLVAKETVQEILSGDRTDEEQKRIKLTGERFDLIGKITI
jgi:hypothetical protein